MIRAINALSVLALVSLKLAAATFSCGPEVPSVRSIAPGMTLASIQKKLGTGTLIARAPNPGLNDDTYYRWRADGVEWRISFDPAMKAKRITFASRFHRKPYDDVTLKLDLMKNIEARFGQPSDKRGPTAGEGEYAFYSVVYRCGPGLAYEIEFSIGRSCPMDMAICLKEAPFRLLPVRQVTISTSP